MTKNLRTIDDASIKQATVLEDTDVPIPRTLETVHHVEEVTINVEVTKSCTIPVFTSERPFTVLTLRINRLGSSDDILIKNHDAYRALLHMTEDVLPAPEEVHPQGMYPPGLTDNIVLLEQGKAREVVQALRYNLNQKTLREGTITREDGWVLVPANHLIIDKMKKRYPVTRFQKLVYYAFSPEMFESFVMQDLELLEPNMETEGEYTKSCELEVALNAAGAVAMMQVYARVLVFNEGAHARVCWLPADEAMQSSEEYMRSFAQKIDQAYAQSKAELEENERLANAQASTACTPMELDDEEHIRTEAAQLNSYEDAQLAAQEIARDMEVTPHEPRQARRLTREEKMELTHCVPNPTILDTQYNTTSASQLIQELLQ